MKANNIEEKRRKILKRDNSLGNSKIVKIVESFAESIDIQSYIERENFILGRVKVKIKIGERVEIRR